MTKSLSFLLGLLIVGFSLLPASEAKAQNFAFQVVGVAPSSWYTKAVIVDVYSWPSYYSWGWRTFYLNIDGYNFPISRWNSLPTSPGSVRAWINIPANYWGLHRLQLAVEFWAQPYYGYPVPTTVLYSFPQFYTF